MGIFGAIAEGVVAIRYDVKIDDAVKAVKELSGEQKKAAKEAVEAHKKEREEFKKKVEDFGKGAAIIGGSIAVARSGLEAYRKESSLMAGAAGVDIDRLGERWDGLKTRIDLLTLAQAGHRGAWKLTTSQLEDVTDGMRALEAKGFDAQQLFERFTDVLKKGKTEGLDDFGLSIKSTGDQAKDLQALMAALGKEVLDVGGNFDSATDNIDRATARWEDGINRVRSAIGEATNAVLDLAAAAGEGLAKAVYGPLQGSRGTADRADVYADAFRRRRGTKIGGEVYGTGMGPSVQNLFDLRQTGADRDAGRALSTFKSALNKGMQGWGPLASTNAAEFAKAVAGLPEDWRLVDEELGKRVDEMQAKLAWRMASGISPNAPTPAGKASPGGRARGGGRGRGAAAANDNAPTIFDGIIGAASGFYDFAMGQAAANQQAQADAMAAYQDRMSQRFADAQMLQDMEAWRTAKAKSDEESFLERTFGKLEEFDQYAAGFATLKSAVTDGFAAWIDGSESLGEAIKKSVAQSIRAYAIEMSGMALVAGAYALYHLATGNIAKAGAYGLSAVKYTAAAGALGYMAKELGGGGSSSVASSAAGVGGRGPSNDNRTSAVVIVGDPLGDDSPRERQRRTRRAMRAAGTDNTGVRNG